MAGGATASDAIPEFAAIARYFAPLAAPGGLGLEDDAAIIASPRGYDRNGHDLVVTKDMLIAGVHFFASDAPASIARKALGVNLSDLAAKGAEPLGFLLGLGMQKPFSEAFLEGFSQGLGTLAAQSHCPLLGGDTVTAPALTISITAFGVVPKGGMVRRQGGNPGDAIMVSGTIGDAALGLRLRLEPEAAWARALDAASRDFLADRYLHPQPRLALRDALRDFATAAMDVSDGLVGDCDKLAARLGRVMAIDAVPLSPAAQAAIALDASLLDSALTGGDDYEVIAAVPPDAIRDFTVRSGEAGIAVRQIGTLVREGEPTIWRRADGAAHAFRQRSYTHG